MVVFACVIGSGECPSAILICSREGKARDPLARLYSELTSYTNFNDVEDVFKG
jgi:hypothetical protein